MMRRKIMRPTGGLFSGGLFSGGLFSGGLFSSRRNLHVKGHAAAMSDLRGISYPMIFFIIRHGVREVDRLHSPSLPFHTRFKYRFDFPDGGGSYTVVLEEPDSGVNEHHQRSLLVTMFKKGDTSIPHPRRPDSVVDYGVYARLGVNNFPSDLPPK